MFHVEDVKRHERLILVVVKDQEGFRDTTEYDPAADTVKMIRRFEPPKESEGTIVVASTPSPDEPGDSLEQIVREAARKFLADKAPIPVSNSATVGYEALQGVSSKAKGEEVPFAEQGHLREAGGKCLLTVARSSILTTRGSRASARRHKSPPARKTIRERRTRLLITGESLVETFSLRLREHMDRNSLP